MLRLRKLAEAELNAEHPPTVPFFPVYVGEDRAPVVLEIFNGRAWVAVDITDGP